MRVCVVSPLYHPNLGGLGRQAQQLTERLAQEGVELFVITRHMVGTGAATYAPGVPVLRVRTPYPQKHILEHLTALNVFISLCFCIGCAWLLWRNRRRYDIVHFHGASLPLLCCLPLLKLLRKPILAKVASTNTGTEVGSLALRRGVISWMFRCYAQRVDAYVATSSEIERGLRRDGICRNRIFRIPNFVDTRLFCPPKKGEKEGLRRSLGLEEGFVALYSGRLARPKGLPYLMKAWRCMVNRHPDAQLLLLGEGPLLDTLLCLSRQYGLTDHIRFCGRRSDVGSYLRAADVLVLSSVREGMPNAVLEAMACGLAIVATSVGGVVDLIEDGKSGVLVPVAEPERMAEALSKLASQPELRRNLGAVAAAEARAQYALGAVVPRYLALYTHLLCR